MSAIIHKIPTMSDEDLQRTRTNAIRLLDDAKRAHEAEQVLNAIDAEFEKRYLPGMITTFNEVYPGGFYGEKQAVEEHDYKQAARELCLNLLAKSTFLELLDHGNWPELIDRASRITNTNLMDRRYERPQFLDAIQEPEGVRIFV